MNTDKEIKQLIFKLNNLDSDNYAYIDILECIKKEDSRSISLDISPQKLKEIIEQKPLYFNRIRVHGDCIKSRYEIEFGYSNFEGPMFADFAKFWRLSKTPNQMISDIMELHAVVELSTKYTLCFQVPPKSILYVGLK